MTTFTLPTRNNLSIPKIGKISLDYDIALNGILESTSKKNFPLIIYTIEICLKSKTSSPLTSEIKVVLKFKNISTKKIILIKASITISPGLVSSIGENAISIGITIEL